ncbi:MAG TPA: hypothetical protein VMV26_12765 [Alphaproteobacteria bacterium]|jgi:hypothetical protein|nr:hypothetical protein [Alphaproteobacteria bacterium]
MPNTPIDHMSPAQIRGARSATRDGRAPAAWKRTALTLSESTPSRASLTVLLRAKGWNPVWGGYLLSGRSGRISIRRKRLAP